MKFLKTRFVVILSAALAVVGLGMFAVGLALGGAKNSIGFEDWQFKVVSNNLKTQTEKLSTNIDHLEVKADALEVAFKVGDEFSVKSRLSHRKLNVTSSGNKAKISTKDTTLGFMGVNFSGSESLVITVPSADQLKQLKLNMDASKVTLYKNEVDLENLTLSEIYGDLDTATLTMNNVSAETIDFDLDASHLNLSNFNLGNGGNIEMSASHLKVENSKIPAWNVRGDVSSLTVNGRREKLTYIDAKSDSDSPLKVDMDASTTKISD